MDAVKITRDNAAFVLHLCEGELLKVQSEIHGARRAYHHERIAMLCERAATLRAWIAEAQAARGAP
jgi:hypothetical protein